MQLCISAYDSNIKNNNTRAIHQAKQQQHVSRWENSELRPTPSNAQNRTDPVNIKQKQPLQQSSEYQSPPITPRLASEYESKKPITQQNQQRQQNPVFSTQDTAPTVVKKQSLTNGAAKKQSLTNGLTKKQSLTNEANFGNKKTSISNNNNRNNSLNIYAETAEIDTREQPRADAGKQSEAKTG